MFTLFFFRNLCVLFKQACVVSRCGYHVIVIIKIHSKHTGLQLYLSVKSVIFHHVRHMHHFCPPIHFYYQLIIYKCLMNSFIYLSSHSIKPNDYHHIVPLFLRLSQLLNGHHIMDKSVIVNLSFLLQAMFAQHKKLNCGFTCSQNANTKKSWNILFREILTILTKH